MPFWPARSYVMGPAREGMVARRSADRYSCRHAGDTCRWACPAPGRTVRPGFWRHNVGHPGPFLLVVLLYLWLLTIQLSSVPYSNLRMEELGTAPGLARILPKIGLSASKAIQAILEGSLLEAISSFGEVHEALGEDRSLYLLFCLNEDLKRLRNRVNEFTHKQEEYLRTDFIGLMFDADRKAQETRSQSRIKRILSKTFKDGNARRACVTASFPIVFEAIVTA